MKRPLLLSIVAAVAYADADITASSSSSSSSLRGEGIEEVGEQIERYPSEDHYIDRRILMGSAAEELRSHQASERANNARFLDEWSDEDIVGILVDDEDEIYVDEFPSITNTKRIEPMTRKSNSCEDEDESEYKILLLTDNYAYETEWKLVRVNDDDGTDENDDPIIIDQGPPTTSTGTSTNYADKSTYSGRWCLPPGRYRFQLTDRSRDGFCSENEAFGCGMLRTWLDREEVWSIINDTSNWESKDYFFDVVGNEPVVPVEDGEDDGIIGGIGGRIDGTTINGNNGNGDNGDNSGNNDDDGEWCAKVRSVMSVPRGTCSLPDGRRGHRVRVTTAVDKYGEETSWTITTREEFTGGYGNGDWDAGKPGSNNGNKVNTNGNNNNNNNSSSNNNNALKMKMEPIIRPNSQVSVEDCLPPGKYNFEITDVDGICCRHGAGSYKLIVDGETLLTGGAFAKVEDHDFQLGFDWISPMNERDCEWWWAHDYRRRDWHTRCYDGQYCGKTYRHLKWSPALAEDAEMYAEALLDSCDTVGILHATDSLQGENLAKNKGSGNWGLEYPADKITKRFVDNEEFWGWKGNAHLTQAMWYSSRYMGCGEAVKQIGTKKFCRMQVCRYVKAGNCQMGQFNSFEGNNWMKPMMADDSGCGPMCASRDGCYH